MCARKLQEPTQRFSRVVDDYVKYRPSYPVESLDCLVDVLQLTPKTRLADVGSGTGILTELLLTRGLPVIAVEPNPEMRHAAEQRLGTTAGFQSIAGRAESTTLSSNCVDRIVVAQAFHWFDLYHTRAEFKRILEPGGVVALMWNKRAPQPRTFMERYEFLCESFGTDYVADRMHNFITPNVLERFFGTDEYHAKHFYNVQELDWDGLLGRLRSCSYIPQPGTLAYDELCRQARRIFETFASAGKVVLEYDTLLFWGSIV